MFSCCCCIDDIAILSRIEQLNDAHHQFFTQIVKSKDISCDFDASQMDQLITFTSTVSIDEKKFSSILIEPILLKCSEPLLNRSAELIFTLIKKSDTLPTNKYDRNKYIITILDFILHCPIEALNAGMFKIIINKIYMESLSVDALRRLFQWISFIPISTKEETMYEENHRQIEQMFMIDSNILPIYEALSDIQSPLPWETLNRTFAKRSLLNMYDYRFLREDVIRVTSTATDYLREGDDKLRCIVNIKILYLLFTTYSKYQWVPHDLLSTERQAYLIDLHHCPLYIGYCRQLFNFMETIKRISENVNTTSSTS